MNTRRTEGSICWSSCKPSLLASSLVPPSIGHQYLETLGAEELAAQYLADKQRQKSKSEIKC